MSVTAALASATTDPVAQTARRVPTASPAALNCSELGFAPAVLKRPRGFQERNTPLARALKAFLRENADGIGQPRRGWLLLAKDEKRAEVAAGSLRNLGYMSFEFRNGEWSWLNGGDCRLRAHDRGRSAVTWARKPGSPTLPPGTTRVPVLVQEDACANGRDARGRVLPPLVHYGRRAITVTYFVRPLAGNSTCQSVPPTPVTLVLGEPLNGRSLRDGGPYPSRPRR